MSPARCRREHTSTEFNEWLKHIHWKEWEEDTRLHYYLARIAFEIYNFRMMWVEAKDRKFRPLEDFLLKFTDKEPGEKTEIAKESVPEIPENPTPEEEARIKKELSARAMAYFGHLVEMGLAEYKSGDSNDQGT